MDTTIFTNLSLAMLRPALGSFVVMTAASIMTLWFLPHKRRHHIRKVGTYLHELCHGIASLATGGDFHHLRIHTSGGGLCLTSGGSQKIIVSAGYIGTILLGAIFLARSAQNQSSLVIMLQILAIVVAFSTIKAGDIHTAAIGIIVAAILGLCNTLSPNATITRFLMNLMGVILLWQGIHALIVLLKLSATQDNTGSDAENLAAITNKHPLHWALVFIGISGVIILVTLRLIVNL